MAEIFEQTTEGCFFFSKVYPSLKSFCYRVEPTIVEADDDLEDLVEGQMDNKNKAAPRVEEVIVRGCLARSQEVKMGGYVEALKRIEDIEKELRGVEGQIVMKKRKFSS